MEANSLYWDCCCGDNRLWPDWNCGCDCWLDDGDAADPADPAAADDDDDAEDDPGDRYCAIKCEAEDRSPLEAGCELADCAEEDEEPGEEPTWLTEACGWLASAIRPDCDG